MMVLPWRKKNTIEIEEILPSYMDTLPFEILIKIFLHLSSKDLISISETCVRFSEVATDKCLLR